MDVDAGFPDGMYPVKQLPTSQGGIKQYLVTQGAEQRVVQLVIGEDTRRGPLTRYHNALITLDGQGSPRPLGCDLQATRPWLTMEWIDGKSLTDLLTEEQLPQFEQTDIAWNIWTQLTTLAMLGLSDIDLNPSNIIVKPNLEIVFTGLFRSQTITPGTLSTEVLLAPSCDPWADIARQIISAAPQPNTAVLEAIEASATHASSSIEASFNRSVARLQVRHWSATSAPNVTRPNQDRWTATGSTFAIADGVGGSTNGAQAATNAVETVAAWAPISDSDMKSAHRHIHSEQTKRNQQSGKSSASTLTTISSIRGQRMIIGHTGDTRAYLIEPGRAVQLTRDHTYPSGGDGPSNLLRSSIGGTSPLIVDTRTLTPQPGNRVLICSDGVHNVLSLETIQQTVSSLDIDSATAELVALAKRRGTTDDATALLLEYEYDDHTLANAARTR